MLMGENPCLQARDEERWSIYSSAPQYFVMAAADIESIDL